MRTYIAEINGEALIAFRAKGDHEAYDIVNEKNGDLQLGLNGFNGVVRPDGSPLWDGETEIKVRPATDDEHETWHEALDAETGAGKQIDPSMGGGRDALQRLSNPYMCGRSWSRQRVASISSRPAWSR